ncbi:MAG: hypothetical protein AAF989_14465 [Planctomycetota bacterium]
MNKMFGRVIGDLSGACAVTKDVGANKKAKPAKQGRTRLIIRKISSSKLPQSAQDSRINQALSPGTDKFLSN